MPGTSTSLYNKALPSYIFVYVSYIAGQKAGPNWLKFVEETLGVTLAKFHGQRGALQLVFYKFK